MMNQFKTKCLTGVFGVALATAFVGCQDSAPPANAPAGDSAPTDEGSGTSNEAGSGTAEKPSGSGSK